MEYFGFILLTRSVSYIIPYVPAIWVQSASKKASNLYQNRWIIQHFFQLTFCFMIIILSFYQVSQEFLGLLSNNYEMAMHLEIPFHTTECGILSYFLTLFVLEPKSKQRTSLRLIVLLSLYYLSAFFISKDITCDSFKKIVTL